MKSPAPSSPRSGCAQRAERLDRPRAPGRRGRRWAGRRPGTGPRSSACSRSPWSCQPVHRDGVHARARTPARGPCPSPSPGTSRRRRHARRSLGGRCPAGRRRRCRCSRRTFTVRLPSCDRLAQRGQQPLRDRGRAPSHRYPRGGRRTRRRRGAPRRRPGGPATGCAAATTVSSSSPAPWPSVSLTVLKSSRSRNRRLRRRAALGPQPTLLQPLDEPAAVGQAGQRVVRRLEAELQLELAAGMRRRRRAPARRARAATSTSTASRIAPAATTGIAGSCRARLDEQDERARR